MNDFFFASIVELLLFFKLCTASGTEDEKDKPNPDHQEETSASDQVTKFQFQMKITKKINKRWRDLTSPNQVVFIFVLSKSNYYSQNTLVLDLSKLFLHSYDTNQNKLFAL